jgi:AcrR family transcriptional regulator
MLKPPNTERRSEKSRQAILTAAIELRTGQGYGRVTMEAIASRAGVSKKTIYRWRPPKGAVALEAVDDVALTSAAFPDTRRYRGRPADPDGRSGRHPDLTGPVLVGLIAESQHDWQLADDMTSG